MPADDTAVNDPNLLSPGRKPRNHPLTSPPTSPLTSRGNGTDTGSATASTNVDIRVVVIVGLLAGALGGLFGVGGGLIIVPGLAVAVGLERRLAHGTSMAATLPIAAAGLATYVANGNVDWAVGALMAIGTVVGAVIGTKLLTIVNKRVLTIIFIITVLATAVRLILAAETSGRGEITVASVALLVIIGLATGTLSGLLGIGGGVVMVPAMIVLFGMTPVIAKGTSVAVIVPTSMMGTIRNRHHHNVDFKVAAIAGACGALTAIPGGMLAARLSDGFSNLMFATLLVLVAVTQLITLRTLRAK